MFLGNISFCADPSCTFSQPLDFPWIPNTLFYPPNMTVISVYIYIQICIFMPHKHNNLDCGIFCHLSCHYKSLYIYHNIYTGEIWHSLHISKLFHHSTVHVRYRFTKKTIQTSSSWWFNPSEKYESNWKSSPNRGEHKKCLKPPPSLSIPVWCFATFLMLWR